VSVAGTTTLDGISNWGVGDWATFNGTTWQRVEGGAAGNFTDLSVSGTSTLSGLTASTALALNASKQVVSVANTGTGDNVLATSPTLVTPALGTPSSVTLTNATGLPVSTGVSGLGTGVATFLATPSSANLAAAVTNETGTGALVFANSPTLVAPNLGTPASGVVTNLTGTASININGTVGATTANTGAFTTLAASGVATFSAGTAATPAITTSGDTNTGIFFPAADTIAFAEGGVERMRIDSDGNVGIGTSSPDSLLTVIKDASIPSGILLSNAAFVVRAAAGGNAATLRFAADNTNQLTAIQAQQTTTGTNLPLLLNLFGGNVGIGTSAPASKLDVAESSSGVSVTPLTIRNNVGTATGSAARLVFTATTAADRNAYIEAVIPSGNAHDLVFATNANAAAPTERMRIDSSGNVGIGTSSPGSILAVSAASPTITLTATTTTGTTIGNKNNRLLLLANSTTLGNGGEVVFGIADTTTGRWGAISSSIVANSAGGATGAITFATKALTTDTSLTERLRITNAGNVGIGTTSPNASAILDAQSTTKGVRMPNMTTTQKNAIASPAAGLMVFDTTLAKLCVYSGSAWETITSI
jgi:hypothetical protein